MAVVYLATAIVFVCSARQPVYGINSSNTVTHNVMIARLLNSKSNVYAFGQHKENKQENKQLSKISIYRKKMFCI
jgi:hypothetical protein